MVGNGERAMFWQDRWINGRRVEIAPNLLAQVPPSKIRARSVKEGLSGAWLRDCGLDLGEAAVPEFFLLWHALAGIQLLPELEDVLT
jgi:hypothetical protein